MTSTPLDRAFALLQDGRAAQAEEIMVQELRAVEAGHGRGGPEWSAAQCDLGTVLFNSGQPDRAIEAYRNACSGEPPADTEHHKDHLTYRLNLGMALRETGRLEEAEAELRRGLQERLSFYGREHSGYAFGLEPLAEVLHSRGDLPQAREFIEEAVANFWRNGHERVASALALRAQIMSEEGVTGGLFDGLTSLPDEVVDTMAHEVMNRAGDIEPKAAWPVMTELAAALEARFGPDHQATVNALSMLANLGGDAGEPAGRVAAIERVLASYDRQGMAGEALMAAQGLAKAYDDAGQKGRAMRAYADALARAERAAGPETSSQVLRNWGLALVEANRTVEGERRLTEAVAHARRGADSVALGRGLVALGLYLQHQDRMPEARPLTEEALGVLDPTHPDAIVARSHLNAMAKGRTCGCDDIGEVLCVAFRDFLLSQVPPGFSCDFEVTMKDDDFAISVMVEGEPTQGEIERLHRAVLAANVEFRRRISRD